MSNPDKLLQEQEQETEKGTKGNKTPEEITQTIPEGLCQCGCGQKTKVFRGVPKKYVHGHHMRLLRASGSTFPVANSNTDLAAALLSLEDGKKLHETLVREAARMLREPNAQALWLLATALREKYHGQEKNEKKP